MKKINGINLFFLFFTMNSFLFGVRIGITNLRTAGRLGDQLLSYCKSKYISHSYSIPFLLTSFTDAHLFQLYVQEERLTQGLKLKFRQIINFSKISVEPNVATLYLGDLHYKESEWKHLAGILGLYEYIQKHADFQQELKNMIAPTREIKFITPSKDRVSIAVHIRKGGGFDPSVQSQQLYTDMSKIKYEYVFFNKDGIVKDNKWRVYSDRRWPCKFPPEQFYVDQIKKIDDYLGNISLYVYIFTDDKRPADLTNRIKKLVARDNITFNCHANNHAYKNTFISDLYSMTTFDCLIRPGSSFSTIAQLIGNHKIIIYPLEGVWIDNYLKVNSACLIDRRGKIGAMRKNRI